MTAKDVRPFLVFASTPTRPLGAALPALATPEVTSPWSPRAAIEAAAPPTADELAAVLDEARACGRAEGLAETAALRARLTAVVDQLAAAHAAIVVPTADTIAEVAACVVETWLGHTDRSAVFAPIVRSWFARSPAGSSDPAAPAAIARVHPDDVAALTAAVGAAPLVIVADPEVAPGAIEIRSAALELSHDWRARLGDLRAAIITALTGAEA
jgi:flagellar biosynthesis/type III secretory pathway protein FliH